MKERGYLARFAVVPIVTAAAVFGGVEGANRYSAGELEEVKLWANYESRDFSSEPLVDNSEPINYNTAGKFLSADPKFVFRGFITDTNTRDAVFFTSRTVKGEKYNLDLVFDADGREVIVEDQAGLLNLMSMQKPFENDDPRLVAFSIIAGSTRGWELLSEYGGEEAQVIVSPDKNTALVVLWKKFVDGKYDFVPSELTDDERDWVIRLYSQTEEPMQGKVIREFHVYDLPPYQNPVEPIEEIEGDFVGVNFELYNR